MPSAKQLTSRPSCSTCRRRKVRCTVPSTDSAVCEQCMRRRRAGEDDGECVVIEHRRGRRVGSLNIKTMERVQQARANGLNDRSMPTTHSDGMSDRVIQGMSLLLGQARSTPAALVTSRIFSGADSYAHQDLLIPSSSFPRPNTLSPTFGSSLRHSFITSDSRSNNADADAEAEASMSTSMAWKTHIVPPPSEVLERSPLILLDRAYEEQGNPGPTESRAKSRRAQQSRFRSRLDVNTHLDPITMGICNGISADELFAFFYAHLSGYAGFLDPTVHTLHHVRTHSTFLLCVILYVSARHHPTTTSQNRLQTVSHALERHIHAKVWPNVLLGDFKSVWICQGAMVWATFLPPAREGEDDMGWSLFAHAIRIAAEIGLNCDPPIIDEGEGMDRRWAERNRERTWLTCFIADRSWATQAGRPPLLAEDDRILHVDRWLENEGAIVEDASIVALVKLRRIISQYQNGTLIASQGDGPLEGWRIRWLGWKWSASSRLGKIGLIYYHYAKMIIRIPHIDNDYQLGVVGNGAELLRFAAREMEVDVLHYAHNNVFTMISFAMVILIQFRACLASNHDLQLTIYNDMVTLHDRLQSAQHANAHCQGIIGWHSNLVSKLLKAWSASEDGTRGQIDGPMPDDLMEALLCLNPTWMEMDLSASFDYDTIEDSRQQ